MINICRKFQIFGDGGDQIVLITENDGIQEGVILRNPFIHQVTMCSGSHLIAVDSIGGRTYTSPYNEISAEIVLSSNSIEIIRGQDLSKIYDPVMQKSVMELLSIINTKINNRPI